MMSLGMLASEQRDVLDVLDVGLRADGTHYGNDVETDVLTDVPELHVVADGLLQVLQLVVVDRLLGLAKKAVAAGLHLYEHHYVIVQRNDVDVPSARLPVALHNGVSLLLQIRHSQVFTVSLCAAIFSVF